MIITFLRKSFSVLALLSLVPLLLYAQSGSVYRRAGYISGNRISTVFGNWGVIAQPCNQGPRFSWKTSTNGYVGDMSIMVGVEFPIKDWNGDETPDTVHSVVTCPVSRPTTIPDQGPNGKYWTFEPVAGYANPGSSSPAIRSRPETWPASWPDHPEWPGGVWHGLDSANEFSGQEEAFFVLDDNNDERFNSAANNPRHIAFHPDTTNISRNGAGLRVFVHYVQFTDPDFQDVFFRIFDIKNESNYDYQKVFFGNLTGTYVGITGCDDSPQEYGNDASVYFSSNDFILTGNYPSNEMLNPRWVGWVGMYGEGFLDAPDHGRIASYSLFTPSNSVALGDDDSLWRSFAPGLYRHPNNIVQDTIPVSGADEDYLYGTNYFSLQSGKTKRIVSVVTMGRWKDEVLQNILVAKALWNSHLSIDSMKTKISFTNFSSHKVLSGMAEFDWQGQSSGSTVDFWFSSDAGNHWKTIAKDVANTGSFSWNTISVTDCPFGLFRVFVKDSAGSIYGFSETPNYFTIKNTTASVPYVKVLNGEIPTDSIPSGSSLNLQLVAGNSNNQPVIVSMFYRTNDKLGDWNLFESFVNGNDTSSIFHAIDLVRLPNSDQLHIKVTASDGLTSFADSTNSFQKFSSRDNLGSTSFIPHPNRTIVPYAIHIIDSAKLTGDIYLITFNDSNSFKQKTYSVFDKTKNSFLLQNEPLIPRTESLPFDGLALYTEDTTTSLNRIRSHWSGNPLDTLQYFMNPTYIQLGMNNYLKGYAEPSDYNIIFSDTVIDTSLADSALAVPAIPVNFQVWNLATGKKIKSLYTGGPLATGEMIFREPSVTGEMHYTWDLYFGGNSVSQHTGDTLTLTMTKGLSVYDTLELRGTILGTPLQKSQRPRSFALYQNYPNPFNPATKIRFDLPDNGRVTLRVFDLLGKEIERLLDNAFYQGGTHEVVFEGSRIASGVYFVELSIHASRGKSPAFTTVRKMVLLK